MPDIRFHLQSQLSHRKTSLNKTVTSGAWQCFEFVKLLHKSIAQIMNRVELRSNSCQVIKSATRLNVILLTEECRHIIFISNRCLLFEV